MVGNDEKPSFALIDGFLCRLNRMGSVEKRRAPIGTVFSEFVVSGDFLYVLEDSRSFLTGMSNLYCLDAELNMLWLAEPPSPTDAYTGKITLEGGRLVCGSREGKSCLLDPLHGKLLEAARR